MGFLCYYFSHLFWARKDPWVKGVAGIFVVHVIQTSAPLLTELRILNPFSFMNNSQITVSLVHILVFLLDTVFLIQEFVRFSVLK